MISTLTSLNALVKHSFFSFRIYLIRFTIALLCPRHALDFLTVFMSTIFYFTSASMDITLNSQAHPSILFLILLDTLFMKWVMWPHGSCMIPQFCFLHRKLKMGSLKENPVCLLAFFLSSALNVYLPSTVNLFHCPCVDLKLNSPSLVGWSGYTGFPTNWLISWSCSPSVRGHPSYHPVMKVDCLTRIQGTVAYMRPLK